MRILFVSVTDAAFDLNLDGGSVDDEPTAKVHLKVSVTRKELEKLLHFTDTQYLAVVEGDIAREPDRVVPPRKSKDDAMSYAGLEELEAFTVAKLMKLAGEADEQYDPDLAIRAGNVLLEHVRAEHRRRDNFRLGREYNDVERGKRK